MGHWPASKPRRVLRALRRIGWVIHDQCGSHITLRRPGWPEYVFPYHPSKELRPEILSILAKKTGLRPEDL